MRPRLLQTVVDAPDHRLLAEFYRQLLGYRYRDGSEPRTGGEPKWIEIEGPETGQRLTFQRDARQRRPDWPEHDETPTQMHLDLAVRSREELDTAVARARELGATVVSTAEEADGLVVLADPVGHPLCILIAG